MNLILLVFAPTILIFFASLTLIQFSVILHMLSIAAVKVRSIPTLQPFAPGARDTAAPHDAADSAPTSLIS